MKLALASDHAGVALKARVMVQLRREGHEAEDLGTYTTEPVDYPDYAKAVSLAVLTGWAWITRFLATRKLDAEAVIQESSMRFLAPVHGEMRASIEIPGGAEIDKFQKMLLRADRGRIRLQVNVHEGATLATVFDGLFAAAMRR